MKFDGLPTEKIPRNGTYCRLIFPLQRLFDDVINEFTGSKRDPCAGKLCRFIYFSPPLPDESVLFYSRLDGESSLIIIVSVDLMLEELLL